MPLYEIQHSSPLTRQQKTELASQITHLHATTFTTPSLFVNIHFTDIDATEENYFIAGRARTNGCNRFTGMVRTSEKRAKKDFDTLAEKIEGIWNLVVRGIEPQPENAAEHGDREGKKQGKKKGQPEETEKEREAKRLHAVFLYPMVAARECGVVVPTVSKPLLYVHTILWRRFRNQATVSPSVADRTRLFFRKSY
jgi:phenylpyruvate tautomerase PptA (4-oxalocrotonate tautomerase family)